MFRDSDFWDHWDNDCPSRDTTPLVGCKYPDKSLIKVVFPDPFGPINAMNSPFSIVKLMSFSEKESR